MNSQSCCANEDMLRRVRGDSSRCPECASPKRRHDGSGISMAHRVSCSSLPFVDSGFLFKTPEGAFMRLEQGRPGARDASPRAPDRSAR